jgi:hypothetical protein
MQLLVSPVRLYNLHLPYLQLGMSKLRGSHSRFCVMCIITCLEYYYFHDKDWIESPIRKLLELFLSAFL